MIFLKKLLLPNLKDVTVRFPLSVICLLIFSSTCIIDINNLMHFRSFSIWLYLLLLCGFFGYTVLRIFVENHNISFKSNIVITIIFTGLLIYLCWNLNVISVFLLLFSTFLLLIIAPYIINYMGETACCNYSTKLASSIFFAVLSSSILCAGLSTALVSVDYLFDIKINSQIYINIWVFGASFFGPFYALSNIPKDLKAQEKEYPKGLEFIFSYLLAPLIIGYFAILYAYIVKIILEWNLPKGNVAYMVMVFGSIGIMTHIFSFPLRETGSKLLRLFYSYFYYALIVPTVVLFIGIGFRINQYGVTEKRYLVALFAVWFLFTSIYCIIKKQPKFKNIILSLSVMMFLASFGFWGASNVSATSQVARLKNTLEKLDILVDSKITTATKEVSYSDRKKISSMVTYLTKNSYIDKIRSWFPKDSYINTSKFKFLSAKTIVFEDIGLDFVSKYSSYKENNNFRFYVSNYGLNKRNLLNISGYDFHTKYSYLYFTDKMSESFEVPNLPNSELQLYKVRNSVLGIKYPYKNISLEFNLEPLIKDMTSDGILTKNIDISIRDNFIISQEKDGLKAKIYISEISGSLANNDPLIKNINFDILVKYPDIAPPF